MADDKQAALVNEVTKEPGIKFTHGGTEYELPRPLPVRVWVMLYASLEDMSKSLDDPKWFFLNFASKVDDVLGETTGLALDDIRAMEPGEYQRVTDELAEQMGEELADASPFSPNQRALRQLSLAGKLMGGAARTASAGGGPASLPSGNSAGATGKP